MPEQSTHLLRPESKDVDSADGRHDPSWMVRNFPSIMGGGVFVLLGLITLIMYIANN